MAVKTHRTAIFAQYPSESGKPYILAPAGRYCNTVLRDVRCGESIRIMERWRVRECIVRQICIIKTDSPAFTFIMRSLFGVGMTWKKLLQQWNQRCELEGLGAEAVSPLECWLIEIETTGLNEK